MTFALHRPDRIGLFADIAGFALVLAVLTSSASGQVVPSSINPLIPGGAPRTPASLQQKARDWVRDGFGPGAFIGHGIGAALVMASPPDAYPSKWRQGAEGFGRNYGNQLAQNATAYTARFGVAALLREDPRYRTSKNRQPAARVFHAVLFTLIDRSDAGRPRLAISNLAGALAAGQVTRAYMPEGFNDTVHAGQRSLVNLGGFAINNVFEEFRPELLRVARRLHVPFVRR